MSGAAAIQLTEDGRLRHLLTTEGLGQALTTEILDTAESFVPVTRNEVKKVPLLRGRTVVNLFFEASTRTRSAFELAAHRLSADVLNIEGRSSSTTKGETLLDTLKTLESMHVDMFVIRHGESGAAEFFARHAAPGVAILNGGDGRHAHPTQGLLDVFTIRRCIPVLPAPTSMRCRPWARRTSAWSAPRHWYHPSWTPLASPFITICAAGWQMPMSSCCCGCNASACRDTTCRQARRFIVGLA